MDRIDLKEFGARLERTRKRHGLTQIELAGLIGQKQANYWKLESGNVSPRGDTIYSLCRALGVSADYLLGLSRETDKTALGTERRQEEPQPARQNAAPAAART